MRRLSLIVAIVVPLLLLSSVRVSAQTSLERGDRRTSTLISPYYFGPNAFPVPDMSDGTVCKELRIEIDGEYQPGYRGDKTEDIFIRANIPLFSDRVNLSLWMTAIEWYRNSDRSIEECRLTDAVDKYDIRSGHQTGDVYVSTDIMVLPEGIRCPSMTIRAVLKSASDDGWHLGRFYDSPGYFFDGTVGKSFRLCSDDLSLRLAARGGFLCWQTDNGRQNDAVMYGLMARLNVNTFFISASWCGYNGWEHNCGHNGELAKDRPMVLRSEIGFRKDNLELGASYQYGVRDFPYHRIRAGIIWYHDILHKHRL